MEDLGASAITCDLGRSNQNVRLHQPHQARERRLAMAILKLDTVAWGGRPLGMASDRSDVQQRWAATDGADAMGDN